MNSRVRLVDAWDTTAPERVAWAGNLVGKRLPTAEHERSRRARHRWRCNGVSWMMRAATLFAAVAALAALHGATPAVASAQGAAPVPPAGAREESVCLGFAFGAFTPKLDWAAAGHRPIHDGLATQQAPGGRGWASDDGLPNDSLLYLFPAWWPVGVLVELPRRSPMLGDTVIGRATALVARGNVTPPAARVRAWRIPCERPGSGAVPQRTLADSGARPR